MDFTKLQQYERKAPSYSLVDRRDDTDYEKHRASSRFFYDYQIASFCSKAPVKDSISMLFVGDLLCQESILEQYTAKDGGYDFSTCFQFMKPLFASVDFVCGNLETPISHTAPYRGDILSHEGAYFCNAPVGYLEALSDVGFDMLTTENNHTLDAGVRGLAETIEKLDQMGIIHTGTFLHNQDKFVIVDICGFKIGFTAFGSSYNTMQLNVTPKGRKVLLNTYSVERAKSIYQAMTKQGAQYTIAFPHWGEEYTKTLRKSQTDAAEELTKLGYDMVLGSHPHVLQKFDYVNEKPVAYSLGNLISHMNISSKKAADLTTVCHVKLTREEDKIVPEVKFIPCRIMKNYRGIPFTVLPVLKSLGLTAETEPALKNTTRRVTSRLGVKESQILEDLPIAEADIEAFRDTFARTEENLAKLSPVEYKKVEVKPIVKPKKPFWQLFVSYEEDHNRLYKVYPKHAELVQNNSTSRVVKLPDKILGRPVTILRGDKQPNSTARLIYPGNFVTRIDDEAFRDHTALESIRLFNTLVSIGKSSFANCTNMTGIVLPKSLTSVGSQAFAGCSNLLSIRIPATIDNIADDAFIGCDKLTIYCNKGSYADTYAAQHNIPRKYMNEAEPALPSLPTAEQIAAATDLTGYVHPFWKSVAHLSKLPMGAMNSPEDKHPATIIAACYYLGHPLPHDAKRGNQPSHYIGTDLFDGTLEAITNALGDRVPRIAPKELKKLYRIFTEKYRKVNIPTFNPTDQAVYFTDWLLFARVQGFNREDYFDCELYNKEADVRATFLDDEYRLHIWQLCADPAYREYFRVKAKFNQKFEKFVSRDSCNVSKAGFHEFNRFLEKHPTFFAKPQSSTGGKGARVLSTDSNTPREIYDICCEENLLAEELIRQHAEIAAFNESTLNTIRIVTLITAENKPQIIWSFARFGRAGRCADNFHAGGLCALLNPETGVIITDAMDQHHNCVTHHPDSGLQFCGFQYPHWDAVKKVALEAALVVPQVRHVGWDVAVNADGTATIVEGNSRSGFDALQAANQSGYRHLYETYINQIEELTNTPYTPAPIPELDVPSMETH